MRRVATVALALAAFSAAFGFVQWWDFAVPALGGARYQAVFLANGQTYFGRYTDRFGPYVKMEDVHYIQTTPAPADSDAPPEQRLLRRGGEPHRPLPRILLPRTAILFVEDLQDASPIVRFIEGRE